jgi:hypothetical protein
VVETTQALAGTWTPSGSTLATGLVSVSIGRDGSVVASSTGRTSTGQRLVKAVSGSWKIDASDTVTFWQPVGGYINGREVAGSEATYRFSRTGDRLTLNWLSGAPTGMNFKGPRSLDIAWGDSWITGAHGEPDA